MGMNLEELEQQKASKAVKPVEVTHQVFGAQDYRNADERFTSCSLCKMSKWAVPGTKCDCGGTRYLYSSRHQLADPRVETIDANVCSPISGFWEMCERGTVGCMKHPRRQLQAVKKFFPCYIHHVNKICNCSQPVIVDHTHLANAEAASLHVLGAMKPDATSPRLNRDDLDYLAINVSRIMAHWARKALGHRPEDERG